MDEHSAAPAAAIDLGTNTALLLIARPRAEGSLEVLEDLCETARLGEGVARTGRLDDVAIERTLGVLAGFRERLAAHGVTDARLRAVGTAVLRTAADAARFLELCRSRLDLEVEVLSETQEARLAYRAVIASGASASESGASESSATESSASGSSASGSSAGGASATESSASGSSASGSSAGGASASGSSAGGASASGASASGARASGARASGARASGASSSDSSASESSSGGANADTVVVDVGGGSSEVVTESGRVLVSAPVGAVVLTEQFLGLGGRQPLTPGGWQALRTAAREAAARFPAGAARGRKTVLLGGTATNLACLELGLPAFDPAAVEGAQVPAHSAAQWADELAGRPLAARQTLPIEADRAEILPAGLACLAACLEQLRAQDVRVSGRGLRYGVLLELLALD